LSKVERFYFYFFKYCQNTAYTDNTRVNTDGTVLWGDALYNLVKGLFFRLNSGVELLFYNSI